MIYDLQKGSLLKRASAFLLDGILLVILITGFAFAFSAIFRFNHFFEIYYNGVQRYAEEFDVDFGITEEDYNNLPEAEKARIDAADEAVNNDPEIIWATMVLIKEIVAIASLSVFFAYLVLEFILPLILKNGQTVGKKVFGLGVMRTNGVRIRGVSMFIRTFMGKYVIETMIPVLIVMMIIFNAIFGPGMPSPGIIGFVIMICLFVAQVILVFWTRKHMMIHDLLSDCVVVDLASQLIFESEQGRLEYISKKDAEEAAISPY